jgi:hypothetical protein
MPGLIEEPVLTKKELRKRKKEEARESIRKLTEGRE